MQIEEKAKNKKKKEKVERRKEQPSSFGFFVLLRSSFFDLSPFFVNIQHCGTTIIFLRSAERNRGP
jgi:hypothetical protein